GDAEGSRAPGRQRLDLPPDRALPARFLPLGPLLLVGERPEGRVDALRRAFADEVELYGRTLSQPPHPPAQLAAVVDRLGVEAHHHVPRLEAGLLRGA